MNPIDANTEAANQLVDAVNRLGVIVVLSVLLVVAFFGWLEVRDRRAEREDESKAGSER